MQMEVDSIRILVEVGRWVAQDAGLSKLSAVVTARCINLGSDQDMYTHYPQLVKQKQKKNRKNEHNKNRNRIYKSQTLTKKI